MNEVAYRMIRLPSARVAVRCFYALFASSLTVAPLIAMAGGDPSARRAAEFNLVTTDGTQVSLARLSGKPVILHFWATWCRACRENDRLLRLWQLEYADQGLAVVGLLERDTRSNLLRYEAPLFVGLLSGLDPNGRVARAYGAADVPQVVFIDRSGRVRATVRGRLEERVLLRDLRRIL